jgi:ABC-type glycerol-3-phosphate transport system substrate-binding protein
VAGGAGDASVICGQGTEAFFVSKDASYPKEAMAFCRYVVSPERSAAMSAAIGIISPLKGGTPREAVSPALCSALDILDGSEGAFDIRVPDLLPAWRHDVLQPALADLLRGDLAPKEFAARLDAGLAAAVEQAHMEIPKAVRYDPAGFGEAT